MLAKQSTARLFLVGPILDADGVAVTGAKTATDVLEVTKNGSVGSPDAQDTMAHSHTGHYVVTTDGGDFDTLGEVTFSLNDGTNAMQPVTFQVVPANTYDSLVSGSALLFSDIKDVDTAGGAEAANLATALGNYSATRGLTGTAVPAAAADGVGGIVVSDAGGFDIDNRAMAAASVTNADKYFGGTGYGEILQRTTIATLASQVSFTLTAGSTDNDAYNGCVMVIEDASTAAQKAFSLIKDYAGGTKTITLAIDPGIFTMQATDIVTILATATATGVWDRLLSGATHNLNTSAGKRVRNIQDFGIYDMASAWVDEAAGTSSGTTDGEDATVVNRSDDFDNAQTVAASVGLDAIHVQNMDTITLTATINGFNVWSGGPNAEGEWTLALGSQDVGTTTFVGATVSGIGTGTDPHFHHCTIGTTTLSPSQYDDCLFTTTFTVGSAGAFRLVNCRSGVAGAGAPTIDMGSGVGATTLELRDWRGGITLNNLAAGDVVTLDGIFGTITLSGADASVEIRGTWKAVTNNLTGTPTVTKSGVEGTDLADALADTNELQTDWKNAGRLDAILDAVLAMLDDPRGEPDQGAPPVNPDAMTKIDYLFKNWRNKKTQTSSEFKLFADDASTVDQKASVSDDTTTATKGEMGTGA